MGDGEGLGDSNKMVGGLGTEMVGGLGTTPFPFFEEERPLDLEAPGVDLLATLEDDILSVLEAPFFDTLEAAFAALALIFGDLGDLGVFDLVDFVALADSTTSPLFFESFLLPFRSREIRRPCDPRSSRTLAVEFSIRELT